ncbi:hypothetical protein ACFFLS_14310 [Flavobacterium procerum]|uniref:Transposase DDE domain-containing protein n=1 Tax=Flavobacterium procerum TaxID=1455569 RepID=A0ABV6BS00_9FLAO
MMPMRNPIEGKFGQAKTAYGLGCIKARMQDTSESWIASIIYGAKPHQIVVGSILVD